MIDKRVVKMGIEVGKKRVCLIEEMIELHLQPKPKWMPHFFWMFLIKQMLILTSDKKDDLGICNVPRRRDK